MQLGVCLQDNVLWDDLTGEEHLYFYGRLKGLRGKELDKAVLTWLGEVLVFLCVCYLKMKDISILDLVWCT